MEVFVAARSSRRKPGAGRQRSLLRFDTGVANNLAVAGMVGGDLVGERGAVQIGAIRMRTSAIRSIAAISRLMRAIAAGGRHDKHRGHM